MDNTDNNIRPTIILEIADAFQTSAILFFANKEGLFDVLETALSYEDVSKKKNWLPWKTRVLLNSLVSMNLLIKKENLYQNTIEASTFLVQKSTSYKGDIIEHERLQWTLWNTLDKIMISENPTDEQQDIRFIQERYDNNVFHNAMRQIADELLSYVIQADDWSRRKKVVDLAGGHGLYIATLVNKFPQLVGEVWDLASARESATSLINDFGLTNRLAFVEKDITNSLSYTGVSCDGILINHCAHHFTPGQITQIFKACGEMLEPNGVIVMIESHLDTGLTTPPGNALFSMYMMINRQYGQVHSTEWLSNELSKNGLTVEVNILNNSGEDALIVARKK